MINAKEVQHAMQCIKKIDSHPTDELLVMYLHERLTLEDGQNLQRAVRQIRNTDDISILVIPTDAMELKNLTDDTRRGIAELIGVEASEDQATNRDLLDKVVSELERILDEPLGDITEELNAVIETIQAFRA